MKKDLFFVSNLRVPSEKAASGQSMTMAAEFSRHFNTRLVVPHRNSHISNKLNDAFTFYGVAPVFSLIKIPCIDSKLIEKWHDKFWFFLLNTTFMISAFFYLLFFANKRTVLYTRDYQLLPVFYLIRFLKGPPYFWESHAVVSQKKINWLKYFRPNGIITLTHAAKNYFINSGIDQNLFHVAPDGVHVNAYEKKHPTPLLREMLGLPKDKTILTYMGRFQTLGKEKGIREIISAAQHLKEYHHILFLFVGGPLSLVHDYKEYINQLGLNQDSFIFLDRVPNLQVPTYLLASDILLMPFPREPHYEINMSPLKMFEYMAAGKPIVTSDLATIREILNDHSAFFCEPGNSQSLAEQITIILQEPDMAHSKAKYCLQLIKELTWSKRADHIVQAIGNKIS